MFRIGTNRETGGKTVLEVGRTIEQIGIPLPNIVALNHRGDFSFEEKSGVLKKKLMVGLGLLSCQARGSGPVSLLAMWNFRRTYITYGICWQALFCTIFSEGSLLAVGVFLASVFYHEANQSNHHGLARIAT